MGAHLLVLLDLATQLLAEGVAFLSALLGDAKKRPILECVQGPAWVDDALVTPGRERYCLDLSRACKLAAGGPGHCCFGGSRASDRGAAWLHFCGAHSSLNLHWLLSRREASRLLLAAQTRWQLSARGAGTECGSFEAELFRHHSHRRPLPRALNGGLTIVKTS